ncbi:CRISPR-associated protein [Gordonia iterans]
MTEIVIGGSHTSALTHFASFGIIAILEEAGHRSLRLRWRDESNPAPTVSGPTVDMDVLAQSVVAHASRHAAPDSWVQARTFIQKGSKKSEIGLFSPRIAAPESLEAWAALFDQRRSVIDANSDFTWLDGQMLQALGEPGYWQAGEKDALPDQGASRWEMKTRNRGEDFTRNRLAPMAIELSGRDASAVASSLAGDIVQDSAGKLDSRTGTGLVPPQPVDDAVAWCALWGISAFRLYPRLDGVAVTPGAWPTSITHPRLMAVPMSTTPMSLAKIRRIVRSKSFSDAVFGERTTDGAWSIRLSAARYELRRSGLRGAVVFPIRKGGSSSAPERQVLTGVFEPF